MNMPERNEEQIALTFKQDELGTKAEEICRLMRASQSIFSVEGTAHAVAHDRLQRVGRLPNNESRRHILRMNDLTRRIVDGEAFWLDPTGGRTMPHL